MSFIHLRLHTAYSLLEGAIKPGNLPKICADHRMPAVGITDTNNMFGALEIALYCSSQGIQPIIGCQVGLKFDTPHNSQQAHDIKTIILLAQNEVGYRNLLKIVTKIHLEFAPQGAPHITIKCLEQYKEGIICLSGGYKGPIGQLMLAQQKDASMALLNSLHSIYEDRFYMELMRHKIEQDQRTEEFFLDAAYDLNIPLVATNDVFYEQKSMYEAHDVLMCIAAGRYISEMNRPRLSPEHYFKSAQEMKELFSDIPEAIHNTIQIAQRCSYAPKSHKPILPAYPTTSGKNEVEELRIQAAEGLEQRLENQVYTAEQSPEEKEEIKKTYFTRLQHELNIIEQMGFPGYFLIVADFIKWAKSHGIPVGPGRGSGAGSLVAWSLTITDIEPIRFNLIFERFLNPERVSMPDFDIDFCQDRRDEVISYVREKYGASQVAHIITFGKLQARAVLRDVGRVLQMPYGQVDKICKLIPNNPANPTSLEQALEIEPQLRQAQETDETVDRLIKIGKQLEGLYRHASTHAAGVVIGDRSLDELVPLYKDERSILPATQFSMKYVEEAGLVKFDFLGLKTLTVIQECCNILKKTGIDINIATIPLNDKKTFELLTNVEAVGVFQVESAGMRDVLRKLKPDRFEDLIALVALYRPGPMDDIPRYIACKQGAEKVTYLHPDLEPILNTTYGVMVYQEQVMQIAQSLAGYSLGAADLLRRAMGKKIHSEMVAQEAQFLTGAVERGIEEKTARQIFEQMAKFAGYGFNKSHSAPYALLTYQTAYLKANYRHEFFAASMTLDLHNIDKLNIFRQDLENSGIPLLPPDINQSGVTFQVEKLPEDWKSEQYNDSTKHQGRGLRYALAAIKNVGMQAMEGVIAERQKNGPFTSIQDFASRIDPRVINKRQLEKLICAGVFDSLNSNRNQLFKSVDILLKHASVQHQSRISVQHDLFSMAGGNLKTPPLVFAQTQDWGPLERLNQEFEALGFYLSAHPLQIYGASLEKKGIATSDKLISWPDGEDICLAGILLLKQERVSKNGQRYAFLQLSDPKGVYEVMIFSQMLAEIRDILVPGNPFFVRATVKRDDESENMRLIAQAALELDRALNDQSSKIEIAIREDVDIRALTNLLKNQQTGNSLLSLKLMLDKKGEVIVTPPYKYNLTATFRSDLLAVPGVININVL